MKKISFKPILADLRDIQFSKIDRKEKSRLVKKLVGKIIFYLIVLLIIPLVVALALPIQENCNYNGIKAFLHGYSSIGNLILKLFYSERLFFANNQDSWYKLFYFIGVYVGPCGVVLGFIFLTIKTYAFMFARASVKGSRKHKPMLPLGEFNPDTKEMRIFISSTFSNMQKIRDVLMCQVFPCLQKEAAERGVRLVPVDLRWGVTEEESKNGKVLGICLDEIDKASPFFIGIIGNRYGWEPERHDYDKDSLIAIKSPIVKEALECGLSATELEIKYGVEWRPVSDDSIILMDKHFVGDSDKQEFLKRWIIDSSVFNCKEYRDIEDFAEKVTNFVRGLLNKYYPIQSKSALNKELQKQLFIAYPLSDFYIEDEGIEKEIDEKLSNPSCDSLALIGNSGIGKFATALHCAQKISDKILTIDLKFSDSEEVANVILENLMQFEIIIMRMSDLDMAVRWSNILKDIKQGLKTIFIISEDSDVKLKQYNGIEIISNFSHDKAFYKDFVVKYLHVFGKKATDNQIERILLSPLSNSPESLKILLNELIVFGLYDLLDLKIDTLCSFENKVMLYDYLFKQAEIKYGKRMVRKVSLNLFKKRIIKEKDFIDENYLNDEESRDFHFLINGFSGFDCYHDIVSFKNESFKSVAKKRYDYQS